MVFPFTHIGGIGWLFAGLMGGYQHVLVEGFVPVTTIPVLEHEPGDDRGRRHRVPHGVPRRAARRRSRPLPRGPGVRRRRRGQAARDPRRGEGGARRRRHRQRLRPHRGARSSRWRRIHDADQKLADTEGTRQPRHRDQGRHARRQPRRSRRGGRDPGQGPEHDARLRRLVARRRGVRRRGLLPHRRPRQPRRRRVHRDHRPAEGRHHPQGREHLGQGGRGPAVHQPAGRRRRGDRPARPALGGAGVRARRPGRPGEPADAEGALRLPQGRGAHGAEDPRAARDRRRAAAQPDGQGAEARAAQAVRGSAGSSAPPCRSTTSSRRSPPGSPTGVAGVPTTSAGRSTSSTTPRCAAVRPRCDAGRPFSLSIPMDAEGPQTGRVMGRENPKHTTTVTSFAFTGDAGDFQTSDDKVETGLQSATHWDALAHAGYDDLLYNGIPSSRDQRRSTARRSSGSRHFGTDGHPRDPVRRRAAEGRRLVRRAVLDHRRRPGRVRRGTPGCGSSPATWCMVRTGQLHWLREGDRHRYADISPGRRRRSRSSGCTTTTSPRSRPTRTRSSPIRGRGRTRSCSRCT